MTEATPPPTPPVDNRRPLGPALDALGCALNIPDDHVIYGAVVLLAVNDGANDSVLRHVESDGLDWFTMRGILEDAALLSRTGWETP
jgi:hypothetical protein